MKIVCLGDSITWGFPWGPDYSWVNLTGISTGFAIVNRGVNGDTTDDLLRRFNYDVITTKPSHVIIMAGTNDACLNMPLKQYAANCHSLCEMSGLDRIIPALGLPIPANDVYIERYLKEYRRWLVDYAVSNRIAVLDFARAFMNDNNQLNLEYLHDDVHPSQKGHRNMAQIAVGFINNWIEKC